MMRIIQVAAAACATGLAFLMGDIAIASFNYGAVSMTENRTTTDTGRILAQKGNQRWERERHLRSERNIHQLSNPVAPDAAHLLGRERQLPKDQRRRETMEKQRDFWSPGNKTMRREEGLDKKQPLPNNNPWRGITSPNAPAKGSPDGQHKARRLQN